jgi:alkylation response protein AidB-like acyl-CoA dehydrogenase
MVDFEMTESQKQIVSTARDFGKEILQPAETKLDLMQEPEDVSKSDLYWKAMNQAYQLGFHKMALPEQFGGLGLDPQTTGMVWEELASWGPGFAASLMSGSVAYQLIAFIAAGNKELVDKYVVPFCKKDRADLISAWGSSEPEVGTDGSNYIDPKVHHFTNAVKKNDRFIINGTKSNFVSNGGIAKLYIAFACVDQSMGIKGSGAFIIPADAKGVSRGKALDKIGLRVLNQSPVFFEDVEIPESYQIFQHGEAYPMLHNSIVTVGNLGVGYLAVGLMRAAYDNALEYTGRRVQWGKPLREHQLVAAKLFEIFQAIESARAFLWKASWLSKQKFPGDLKMSLAAKVYATNQAVRLTAEMVQVLGGYGISKEYPLEKFARDAHLTRIMDGANDILTMKAAAHLEKY